MAILDEIKNIFNTGNSTYVKPVPGGNPGDFYLTPKGDAQVKKVVTEAKLPVIEYTESLYPNSGTYGGYIFYVPSSVKGPLGNIGLGGQVYPSTGKSTDSLYQWTRDMAKQGGANMQADPLGLNYMATKKGASGPVVQYKKLPETGLPSWYPQPTGNNMSGASIIYENGKPKKVITGVAGSFLEYDIVNVV